MLKQPAVYIPASKQNGTLYTGVTGDLQKRAWEHRNNMAEGFTGFIVWSTTSCIAI